MRTLKLLILSIVFFSLLSFGMPVTGYPDGAGVANARAVYHLRNAVIGAAGSPGQSANYATNGTLGQPTPIGIGAVSDVTLYAGFWGRYWIPTDVEETPPRYRTMLRQNFPNPFNPSTTIEYSLAEPVRVEIEIFDVGGRSIRTLVDAVKPPGLHRAVWDGKNDSGGRVSSGIFFCRFRAGSFSSVKKMVLLK